MIIDLTRRKKSYKNKYNHRRHEETAWDFINNNERKFIQKEAERKNNHDFQSLTPPYFLFRIAFLIVKKKFPRNSAENSHACVKDYFLDQIRSLDL